MLASVSMLGGYGLVLLCLVAYLAFVFFVTLAVAERTVSCRKVGGIVSAIAITTLPFMAARPAAIAFPF